ncbi:MAG TPA: CocE/NonD family hydrolase [Candidatus Thermoplasmatota archaeon]
MRSSLLFVTILAVFPLASVVSSQAEPTPLFTKEDFTIEADDGVTLAASAYRPASPGPYASILLTHGWPEWRGVEHVKIRAERWASQGFFVVAYDSRGFGGSAGETTLDGPREVQDAQHFIDWIAAQPDVQMESSQDPVLGMLGRSYAGGVAQLTAMVDPRIDALIPEITWQDLYRALIPNDVIKVGWVNLLYYSGQAETHGVPAASRDPNNTHPDAQGGASAKLTEWYASAMATNEASPELKNELHVVRSSVPSMISVPTMLIQGWNDTLFDPRHATASFMTLRDAGVPAKLVLFSGGHGIPLSWQSPQSLEIERRIDAWFDLHLRANHSADWVSDWPVEHWYPTESRFQGEASWPPLRVASTVYYLSGTEEASIAGGASLEPTLPDDGEAVRLAQLAAPTNYVEVPNFQQYDPNQEHGSPGTSVVFATEPLAGAQELLGAPIAYLTVSREAPNGEVIMMVRIVDVAPDGTMTTVLKQVTPTRVEFPAAASAPAFVAIELAPLTHTFEEGHRIGFAVTTSDPAFGASREANTVRIGTGRTAPSYITVPLVLPGISPDPIGPFAVFESLPSQVEVGANITFRVTSHDNVRVANLTVEVLLGDLLVRNESFSRPPASVSSWFRADQPGTYRLRATASDVVGTVYTADDVVEARVPVAAPPPVSDDNETPAPDAVILFVCVAAAAFLASRRRHDST